MPAPLHLSIVTNDLLIGGVQRNVVAFLRHLDRARFSPSVCLVCAGGELADEVRALGIPLEVFHGVWKDPLTAAIKYPHPMIFRRVAEFYRRQGTQIAQTRLFLGNWFGRAAAKRAGVPVVVAAEHSTYTHKNFLHHWIDRRMARYCQKIVAVSDTVKTHAIAQSGISPSLFTTIYNGIDLERFDGGNRRDEVRREFGVAPEEFLLGSAARVIPEKNYQGWLDTFARLRAMMPRTRFLLAGDGPDLPELKKKAAALGLGDSVMFAGMRDDIPRLLSAMDLFILPSRREGLPTVILEAMAMRVPVVAQALPQMREIIGEPALGTLLNFDNPLLCAEEIVRLLASPERRAAMSAAGRAHVEAKFSIHSMVQEYCALYESLWRARGAAKNTLVIRSGDTRVLRP